MSYGTVYANIVPLALSVSHVTSAPTAGPRLIQPSTKRSAFHSGPGSSPRSPKRSHRVFTPKPDADELLKRTSRSGNRSMLPSNEGQ
jgi:hypothetical protein